MSNFLRLTKNPLTGQFEQAYWLDNYFGRHRYGVEFPDGRVYRQSDYEWEFADPELPECPECGDRHLASFHRPPDPPPMVPSAKERIDAVYDAWESLEQDPDIEVLHERAMREAYEDGGVVCREKLAAMMLRCSIPTGHGDTFDDLLDELETAITKLQLDDGSEQRL